MLISESSFVLLISETSLVLVISETIFVLLIRESSLVCATATLLRDYCAAALADAGAEACRWLGFHAKVDFA